MKAKFVSASASAVDRCCKTCELGDLTSESLGLVLEQAFMQQGKKCKTWNW